VNVYFISGLCTGCYIFQNIKLPQRYNVRCLDWLEPNGDEPLQTYIARLTAPIDTTKPFVLVGLSFGGMIASELNKTLNPLDTILVSSVPTYKFIPMLYRLSGSLRLYNFARVWMAQAFRPVIDWIIGAKRSKEEMALLHKTIAQLSPRLLRWSLKQVTLSWRNTIVPEKYFHIHGSADRLLPVGKMKPNVLIKGGSHFMVVSHAKEISEAITQRLDLLT
jgi:pimeloyl-ACP methyl ester carboxylesterase